MYRFPWYLTLVSTNHASSNPGQNKLSNHRIFRSIFPTKVWLIALNLLYFRGASYNRVSPGNRTKLSQILDSSCSSSFLLSVFNDFYISVIAVAACGLVFSRLIGFLLPCEQRLHFCCISWHATFHTPAHTAKM